MVSASMTNCVMMLARVAPSALRTPISRVRSVTDTSMMFMMPMPPTSRLTAAMLASRKAKICVDAAAMSMNWRRLRIMKSLSSPARILCSRRSTRSMSTIPISKETSSATRAESPRSRSVPKTRSSAVVKGMNMSSSGSGPKRSPTLSKTPITSNGTRLTNTVWPTRCAGSMSRLAGIAAPRTATRRLAARSPAVNMRPCSTSKPCTSG